MLEPAYLLPEEFVSLRPMQAADVALVVGWITAGRGEGAFRQGPELSARSLLEYQASLAAGPSEYRCLIVESRAGPIGYIDYRYGLQPAEVLGLYLEPPFRRKRLGRHLLRWATAALGEAGCTRVDLELYATNLSSLRAAHAAGFILDGAGSPTEGDRLVQRVYRLIQHPQRLSPAYARYRELRGDNLYLHHVALAEALAERLGTLQGIEMVLGLGSLAHGFADRWSDLDLAILGRGEALQQLWRGEKWAAGVSIDLSVVDLDEAPPETWDDERVQAFSEGIVLHQHEPSGSRWLAATLALDNGVLTERILELLMRLGWTGFQPRAWYGRDVHGYRWCLPHDLWLRRGCVASAHAVVDQAMDLTIQLVFLANSRRVPDFKWRRYLVMDLPWLPDDFATLMHRVEERRLDDTSFHDRADALLSLIERTVTCLEARGFVLENIYNRYLASEKDY